MVAFTALVIALFAQQPAAGPSQAELDAMKKLDFLVGSWKGGGSMMMGPGQNSTYEGSETVQKKLQGKALLVEGKFTDPKTKAVVHETLAVIIYDVATKKYKIQTHLFNQPSADHELNVMENGFWWEIVRPQGPKVKFTMSLNQGEWVETGIVTIEGREPIKFLEMKLKKGG